MGLKKYEIITVGRDKRVRALRSWAVGGRYVNVGDVGGIVYDEKTLSQDGLCWLFKGNFGFPGARIGGDSIVDVDEAELSAAGAPNVDILGSSVVVGSKLQFKADQTEADAVVLTADDFEQGMLNFVSGANWETMKSVSNNYVRTKAPIFMGGMATTLKLDVPGYAVQAYVLDRDGNGITATASTRTGVGATLAIPAGQYFLVRLVEEPFAAMVPADATAAKITFTGTYETKLSVIDSRVEINPATSTGVTTIRPGGIYTIAPGAKYPESIIRNSKVSVTVPAAADRVFILMGRMIGSTATLDATAGHVAIAGLYSNIKNLTVSGVLTSGTGIIAYDSIQATDCDNFVVSPTIFPGLAAAVSANMPFIFQGCDVPNGIFYHHAQIANTYKNIDFAKASVDLGKAVPGDRSLVSSEVEGMYRVHSVSGTVFGALVESYESVRSLLMASTVSSYGTIIYKDAYFNGKFDFAGTNVFGNTKKHDTQDVSGCKIVNTGATAVNMKGNIRVEGNAALTNVSITGTGYFGGNAVMSGMAVNGYAYMKDNTLCTKTSENVQTFASLVMEGNAVYNSIASLASNGLKVYMYDNSKVLGELRSVAPTLIMRDNATITAAGNLSGACVGAVTIKDNAVINTSISTIGDITLCGDYVSTSIKTWTGKRVIDNENEPEYDDNVKTQYDF
ncbi:hypothetical protein BK735P2_00018 [Bacteroides phage BK735P2]|nr:hypothetical protein BK735P2_00018 [Bacteroides phage BK735P2]